MIAEANAATPRFETREPALIARALAGDRDAFGELYALHHPAVLAYVQRRVRNRQVAEDITGETFLNAWMKRGTFTYRGIGFVGWLITIARNKVIDHCKSAQRREFVVEDMLGFDEDLTVSTEDTVLISLDEELLRRALEQLRPPQREVLTRRFLMEFSVLETARQMERSEGAVKTLQFRALAKLRSEYLGVAA
ncbi:RNA polymerase sigma factor [Streptomyces aureus]|uniref:RNA polymerase sigma factor n=1 Tax=Streptomyces aureus TaxID=193461 RepID=UPI00068A5180|nr:sigma-70 family RNA polymerase sigma factor [Streptomyces aureus]